MRLSISHKVFLVFSLLTALGLLMSGFVLFTLNSLSNLERQQTQILEFQLQTQKLRSLQNEVFWKQTSEKETEMGALLLHVQKLAGGIDLLLKEQDLAPDLPGGYLMSQVEYYRQAFIELSRLYKNNNEFLLAGSELIEVVDKRVSFYSADLQAKIQPLLVALLRGQIIMHYLRDSRQIGRLKRQVAQVGAVLHDPLMEKSLQRLIGKMEADYINHLALQDREKFLGETAANFARVSKKSLERVAEKLTHSRQRLGQLAFIFSVLMIGGTLVVWRLSASYFGRFVRALRHAVSAIHAGDFDFQLPRLSNDELGDQVRLVKTLAGRLEEKLQLLTASKEQYRDLVENVSDWIWSIDKNGVCTFSSSRLAPLVGVERQALLGQKIADIVVTRSQQNEGRDLLAKIGQREPFENIAHAVEIGGKSRMDLETSGSPIFDGQETFQGFRLLTKDIRERSHIRKQAQRQADEGRFFSKILRLSLSERSEQEVFDRFLKIILDAQWLGLQATAMLYLADQQTRTLTLTAFQGLDPFLQKKCSRIPFGVCLCGKAAESGKVLFCSAVDERHEIGYEGMHMHGHYCVPIHSVAGEVIGLFSVHIAEGTPFDPAVEEALSTAATILGSIIKRRQAEAQLKGMNEELEDLVERRTKQLTHANKELDTFAYSVSHDLRAPLRAIDGFSLALMEDYGERFDTEGKGYLQRLRNGCQKMGQLIEDILQLSRLTRNEMNVEECNLSQIAENSIEVLRQADTDRDVAVSIEAGMMVDGDPVMLRVVLDNLLGNAWKYSSKCEHAQLSFSREQTRGREWYCVRDNGAGFDMRYQEKLFAAFQRLHSSEDFEGTGIGLATVQRIIHRHGGEVWAEGEEGKGAAFYFSLN